MTTRHAAAGFAGGALVFPGGKVDPADARLGAREPHDAATIRKIAAIRETYEEAGILMARAAGSPGLVSHHELAELPRPSPALEAMLDSGRIVLATDALVPFAHWITPKDRPKRFDTWFFLAAAPDQVARHDGREAVDVRWVSPLAALRDADAGTFSVVFATRMNLAKLGRSTTVAQALDAARASTIMTVCPEYLETATGPVFRIPAAADYGVCDFPAADMPRA